MKISHLLIPVTAIAIVAACKTHQAITGTPQQNSAATKFSGMSPYARPDYHGSASRYIDLIHTALDVTPDWKKRYLYGEATITAKPYFYPTSVAELDARGMDIRSIQLIDSSAAPIAVVEPKWKYENNIIHVELGRTLSRSQKFTLKISYVAKPNELKSGGSAAISDDRGLYFIDPDGTDPNIPTELWTQGETQAASAWFPTVDRPNERMTSEITMHVDSDLVTLSNGLLVSSRREGAMKIDHWKMDMPSAPYLMMMAAGHFTVVKDSWRGKEVSYYVDPEYGPYARSVFGKTPRMIEFFSSALGVDYPWQKYSQICGHEYVSGAMENTTATLHSDYLQMDDRELIDGNFEDYISHELFHQWFGDYVTCESWSNLPLNESFATYGEYLWIEHEYGREMADVHHYESLQGYLAEAGVPYDNPNNPGVQVPLIRFDYDSQEDMFDRHSYNKGGQVLHMLRLQVGDEAFFASLKLYLEMNKFQSVEIHNLRLAFEQTTGQDLNWFFDQWFLSPGHPELDIAYAWDEKKKEERVIIQQIQNYQRGIPVFRLPLDVDVYAGGKVNREHIVVDSKADTFYFDAATKPDLVNVDAQKALLCWKKDHHTPQEWAFQYRNCPTYVDRVEALNAFTADDGTLTPMAKTIFAEAIRDHNYNIRAQALHSDSLLGDTLAVVLKTLALRDSSSAVRAAALANLADAKDSAFALGVARIAVNDSSFAVFAEALRTITRYSHEEGMKLCVQYESATHRQIKLSVASVYAQSGSDAQQPWFERTLFTMSGRQQINFLFTYISFLRERCSTATVEKALGGLEDLYHKSFSATTRFYITIAMRVLERNYQVLSMMTAQKIEQLGGPKKSNPRIDQLKENQKEYDRMVALIEQRRKTLQ